METGDLAETILAGRCLLAVSPWVALLRSYSTRRPRSEFDRLWRGFRDRFGLWWGLRVREQFDRSAANAGWPVHLGWRGLRRTGEPDGTKLPLEQQEEMVATLRAILKRFGPEEKEPS
jgi:hypothetical protein